MKILALQVIFDKRWQTRGNGWSGSSLMRWMITWTKVIRSMCDGLYNIFGAWTDTAEAEAAGRVAILLSDHGHVIDRHTEQRESTDGLRWRRPGEAALKEELEVRSSRVVMPDGSLT